MSAENLDDAVLDLLQEFTGIRFSEILRECLKRSLPGSGNNNATYGLTTTRILLSFLFFGKHRPRKDEELTRFSDFVGVERISELDELYRRESELFDSEVGDLANSNDNFTRKVQTLFARTRDLVLPTQQQVEPYHVLATLLRDREFDYDWLVKKWNNFRDEAASAVFFYDKASEIPTYELASPDGSGRQLEGISGTPDNVSAARGEVSKLESAEIKDWEIHLERRYNARFSTDGIELIAAAAAQSQKIPARRPLPSGILNTRDFLMPMMKDPKLLKGLKLGSSMTVVVGGSPPPWVEDLCERDSNPDSPLAPGNLLFSRQVDEALREAANLAAQTPAFRSINKWHIAGAIIASHAPGISTALADGGTDLDQAVEVLLANTERHEPQFFASAERIFKASRSSNDNISKRTGHGTFGAKEFIRPPKPDRDPNSIDVPPLAGTNIPSEPDVSAGTNESDNSIEPKENVGPTSESTYPDFESLSTETPSSGARDIKHVPISAEGELSTTELSDLDIQPTNDVASNESRNEARLPATNFSVWRDYFENHFSSGITDEAAKVLAKAAQSAASRRGEINNLVTVNTKDLLLPLTEKYGPLRMLSLSSHAGGYTGHTPWDEHQTLDGDLSYELRDAYGSTRPSEEFVSMLETATELARKTSGFEKVTEWHLAFVLILSAPTGFTWQLESQKSSLNSAAKVLRRNVRNHCSDLEPLLPWAELRLADEPEHNLPDAAPTEEFDSKVLGRAFEKIRNPRDFKWSANCGKILDKLWQAHGIAASSARQSDRRARDFNPRLTSREFFLSALLHGATESSNSGSRALPGRLYEETGKSTDTLWELLNKEIHRGSDTTPSDNPVATDDFLALVQLANGIRTSTGDDTDLSSRHLVAAFLTPLDGQITGSRVLKPSDEIDPSTCVREFEAFLKTDSRMALHDSHDKWAPIVERLRANLTGGEYPKSGLAQEEAVSTTEYPISNLRGTISTCSRDAAEHELAIGIKPIAESIQTLFETTPANTDLIFALYGPWGRGKTTLMDQVRKKLKDSAVEDYAFVDFSAWKFPTRPEVWVNLYETIVKEAARIPTEKYASGYKRSRLQQMRIGIRCGILKSGWTPIYVAFALIALTQLPQFDAYAWIKALLGVSGLVALMTFVGNATTLGRSVAQRYFALPDHSSQLGMQAVIGNDLNHLLRTWIEPTRGGFKSENAKLTEQDTVNFAWFGQGFWKFVWAISIFPAGLLTTCIPLSTSETEAERIVKTTTYKSTTSFTLDEPPLDVGELYSPKSETFVEITDIKTPQPKADGTSVSKRLLEKRIVLGGLATLVILFACLVMPRPRTKSKLLLVIDDLDRCRPDQMLSVIESLRLFLDNPEMSRRMQIAMLVDDRLLGHALLRRASEDGIQLEPGKLNDGEELCAEELAILRRRASEYIREQREKLFLAELRLSELTVEDLTDIANFYLPDTKEAKETKETKEAKEEVDPSAAEDKKAESKQEIASDKPQDDQTDGTVDSPATSQQVVGLEKPTSDHPASAAAAHVGPSSPQSPDPIALSSPDEDNPATSERRFSQEETVALREAIIEASNYQPTPRQLRTFLARYQLARLLLDKQDISFQIKELIACVAYELQIGSEEAANIGSDSILRQIARIVVCPPSTYLDDLRTKHSHGK